MADSHVALAESLHAKQDKMAPEQVNMRDVTGRPVGLDKTPLRAPVMDEQFPTDALTAKDARDRVMEAKLQLQQPDQPGYTPFGKLEAKDSDFEWYQRKQAAIEVANFEAWFAREFDMMNPADKKRAKELYPQFYRQRKKLLKRQTKNLFELARLKLEGVQDMNDLKTQYLAETGRLDLGPLQNLLHPESELGAGTGFPQWGDAPQREKYAQSKFQRGLLSPFRIFGAEATPYISSDGNPWSGEVTRSTQATMYRPASERVGLQFGITQGFPPMGSDNTLNQQDKQWWQKLQGQF
jgi:hypothetical protein